MKAATARLHTLLAALAVVCVSGAQGIRVKFGTNDGPIVPPTPEPRVAPVPPFRAPAPVWEDRSADLPDPNVNWRPLFVPSPRYTQVTFNSLPPPAPTPAPAQTSAQRFVSAYLPKRPAAAAAPAPASAQPGPVPAQYFQPAHQYSHQVSQLSSQSVPGVGIRYFVPAYAPAQQKREDQSEEPRQEDARQNRLDNDDVAEQRRDAVLDAQLGYEKESARRARHSLEGSQNLAYYQWPVYTPYRHQ